MGASFAKYSNKTKKEMALDFATSDSIELQLAISLRLYGIVDDRKNKLITEIDLPNEKKEMKEIECLTQALQSKDPYRIHCAVNTRSGMPVHDPATCYYKTMLRSKCPLAHTENVE